MKGNPEVILGAFPGISSFIWYKPDIGKKNKIEYTTAPDFALHRQGD
jgi:hypothetical protein